MIICSQACLWTPSSSDLAVWFVAAAQTAASSNPYLLLSQQDGSGTGRSIFYYNATGQMANFFAGTGRLSNSDYQVGSAEIQGFGQAGTSFTFYKNGASDGSSTVTPESATGNWVVGIGKDLATQPLDGKIAELLVYDATLSSNKRSQIDSYLALKYGISLDSTNYLDSLGNTIWDATANATYHNDVTGIGVDNGSALSQLTSRSINDDSIVTITGTLATISSGEFLLWGNDNGATTASTEVPAGYTQRLTREWKVAETGDAGNVTISFDLTGISGPNLSNPAGFALLIDSDGDFSDATATTGATVSGPSQVTFTGVDFADGQYFSLAYE